MDIEATCNISEAYPVPPSPKQSNESIYIKVSYDIVVTVNSNSKSFELIESGQNVFLEWGENRSISVSDIKSAVTMILVQLGIHEDLAQNRMPRHWNEFEEIENAIKDEKRKVLRKVREMFGDEFEL